MGCATPLTDRPSELRKELDGRLRWGQGAAVPSVSLSFHLATGRVAYLFHFGIVRQVSPHPGRNGIKNAT